MDRKRLLMSNNWGSAYTPPRAGLAAQFDANYGITSSGGFASAWADRSGNGRNLLQATGANQPIHLPYSGTKYGYLPGVNGNSFTTPDSVAGSPTGDIEIIFDGAATDWTPSTDQVLACKDDGGTQRDVLLFFRSSTGRVELWTSATGASYVGRIASATAALTLVNGVRGQIKANRVASTGDTNFYTSTDGGANWTKLGDTVSTTAGAIHDGTAVWSVGALSDASKTVPFGGKVYGVTVSGTIGGAAVINFDPSRWTSGTTFTASTGETWTINSTGSKPAQIVDRPSVLFDGSAHFLKASAFTLNQPCAVFFVGNQITWTSTDVLLDGNAVNTGAIIQTTATPQINLNAGSSVAGNTEMTVGARKVICAVFNGASSSLQVTNGTATTGNAGAGNMGGVTLGAAGSNLLFSNIQANELLVYNVAPDAATRANIIRALMAKHGVS